jgi:hypothetical protein
VVLVFDTRWTLGLNISCRDGNPATFASDEGTPPRSDPVLAGVFHFLGARGVRVCASNQRGRRAISDVTALSIANVS